jgi:hypothetical protein
MKNPGSDIVGVLSVKNSKRVGSDLKCKRKLKG